VQTCPAFIACSGWSIIWRLFKVISKPEKSLESSWGSHFYQDMPPASLFGYAFSYQRPKTVIATRLESGGNNLGC
jgi:hypothetical protein